MLRPRNMSNRATILVFDSGLGGLTVLREIVATCPGLHLVYAADDAAFPYGEWDDAALTQRVVTVMGELIARYRPDLVVVACNTASTIALAALRATFAVPFVGTVPAIKPACLSSRSKLVSVLGTEATVAREYTRALIQQFANGCAVTLVGSKHLAPIAEAALRGQPVDDALIAQEIRPCFIEANGARTDTVVLACTHYPLLLDRLTRLSPWPVSFIDPAPAIARRLVALLGPAAGRQGESMLPVFHFTSGKEPPAEILAAIAKFAAPAPTIAAHRQTGLTPPP
jgi:glutamate racemase